jgi:hypothetical protein
VVAGLQQSSASMRYRHGYCQPSHMDNQQVGLQGDSDLPFQYHYPPQRPYLAQPSSEPETSSPHFRHQRMAPLPSYQSPEHWGLDVQRSNRHPQGHLHSFPHAHPQQQQGGGHSYVDRQQLLLPSPSAVDRPQQTLARSSSVSSHPGFRVGCEQLEKPGGGGSYALGHTGRESHQNFLNVDLEVASQSIGVVAHPNSAPDQPIGPKTEEDKDDADFGDQLKVSFFSLSFCLQNQLLVVVHLPLSLTCGNPCLVYGECCSLNKLWSSYSSASGTSGFGKKPLLVSNRCEPLLLPSLATLLHACFSVCNACASAVV